MLADVNGIGYYRCMKDWLGFLFTTCLVMGFSSCAGYKLRDRSNPFEQENIKKVAIPIFVNKSSYAGAGPIFTREIVDLLGSYSGLKISPVTGGNEDAVLVGIVEGPRRNSEAFTTTATKFTAGELKQSIGNRAQFYLPTASNYKVTLRVLLIKNPSTADIKLLTSPIAEKLAKHPRVIFNKSFGYVGNFNRETRDTITSDSGGLVNYTKTRRYFQQSLEALAKQASRDLEDLVINVF